MENKRIEHILAEEGRRAQILTEMTPEERRDYERSARLVKSLRRGPALGWLSKKGRQEQTPEIRPQSAKNQAPYSPETPGYNY